YLEALVKTLIAAEDHEPAPRPGEPAVAGVLVGGELVALLAAAAPSAPGGQRVDLLLERPPLPEVADLERGAVDVRVADRAEAHVHVGEVEVGLVVEDWELLEDDPRPLAHRARHVDRHDERRRRARRDLLADRRREPLRGGP